MKQKEIYLSPEEIQYMLQGTLLWSDVAHRANTTLRSFTGLRRLGEPIRRKNVDHLEKGELKKWDQVQYEKSENSENSDQAEGSKPVLKGTSVIWLLLGVGIITISAWLYFAFVV